jgi:hypothetical protein
VIPAQAWEDLSHTRGYGNGPSFFDLADEVKVYLSIAAEINVPLKICSRCSTNNAQESFASLMPEAA